MRRLEGDGMTLPNGRALGATEEAWRDFLGVLKDSDWTTSWPSSNGRWPSTLAELADEAFASCHVEVSPAVSIVLYPSWGTDQVWFDFAWEPMRTQADVDVFSTFVRVLGRTTGHQVHLSYEGDDENVFATYDSDSDSFSWAD